MQKQLLEKLNNIEYLILDGSDHPYTFLEACRYLHFKPSYLYKLTAQKKIPFYKPAGKKIYFYRRELNEWIREKYGKKSVKGDE